MTDNVPDDYDLNIDKQVEKFLELKHKLTFFIITAAIGSLAFTLNFAIEKLDVIATDVFRAASLIVASIFSLIASGSALLSLHGEIGSYQLHIKYRYERKIWSDVPEAVQVRWTRLNQWAQNWQVSAFVFLALGIALQVIFFLLFLKS